MTGLDRKSIRTLAKAVPNAPERRSFRELGRAGARNAIVWTAIISAFLIGGFSRATTPNSAGMDPAKTVSPLEQATQPRGAARVESQSEEDEAAAETPTEAETAGKTPAPLPAIPEPQTWVVVFSGLGTLLILQRVRRRRSVRKA